MAPSPDRKRRYSRFNNERDSARNSTRRVGSRYNATGSRDRSARRSASRRSASRSQTRRSPTRRSPTRRSPSRRSSSPQRREPEPTKLCDQTLSVSQVKALIEEQQANLLDILSSHKEEIDQNLDSKSKIFKKPGIGKQFNFNSEVLTTLVKCKKDLKKSRFDSCTNKLKETIKKLETQQSDLIVADQSRYGFLTVSMLHGNAAIPKGVAKKVERIENQLDKTLPADKKHGGNPKDNKKRDTKSSGRFDRRKQGPEELLQDLKKRTREGKCGHCGENGHFFRECPSFWQSVCEARVEA